VADTLFIVAQGGGFDFELGDLIYPLIVLLSMLGGLGKWIRDRSAKQQGKPESPLSSKTRNASAPPQRPAARSATPTRAVPSARPVPVAQPARAARPTPTATPPPPRGPEAVLAQMLERLVGEGQAEPSAHPADRGHAHPPQGREISAPPPRERTRRVARPLKRAAPIASAGDAKPSPTARDERRTGESTRVQRRPVRTPAVDDWSALSVAELQRAIVLREVLGPPVALRGESNRILPG
jgi:hypothetical protein